MEMYIHVYQSRDEGQIMTQESEVCLDREQAVRAFWEDYASYGHGECVFLYSYTLKIDLTGRRDFVGERINILPDFIEKYEQDLLDNNMASQVHYWKDDAYALDCILGLNQAPAMAAE